MACFLYFPLPKFSPRKKSTSGKQALKNIHYKNTGVNLKQIKQTYQSRSLEQSTSIAKISLHFILKDNHREKVP